MKKFRTDWMGIYAVKLVSSQLAGVGVGEERGGAGLNVLIAHLS